MAENDLVGGDSGAELAFERELVASAAADRVSRDAVQAAWSRFAVALGATATLADATTSRATAGAKLAVGGHGALGWISLGALGGGLATAVLMAMLGGHGAAAVRGVAVVPSAPAAVGAGTAAVSSTARNVTPDAGAPDPAGPTSVSERAARDEASSGTALRRPGAETHAHGAAHGSLHRAANGGFLAREPTAVTDTSTSLAAEIALLDAARRARDAGDFDGALALLGRYQREHPHGELRRESDVLKLETLSLRGDRDEATRLARHFLTAFPDDPHVAHVRTLAQ